MQQPGKGLLGHIPQLSHKPSLQAGQFQSCPVALTLCKCQVNSCLCVATSSSAFSECCGFLFFQTFSTLSWWGNPQVQRANSARNWSKEGIQCSKSRRKRQQLGRKWAKGAEAITWRMSPEEPVTTRPGLQLAGDAGERQQTSGRGSVCARWWSTLGRSACLPGAYPLPAPSAPAGETSAENLGPWHSLNCYRTCVYLLALFFKAHKPQ